MFGEGIDSPGSWKPPPRKVEKGREEAFAAKQVGKSSAIKLVLAQRHAKSANAKNKNVAPEVLVSPRARPLPRESNREAVGRVASEAATRASLFLLLRRRLRRRRLESVQPRHGAPEEVVAERVLANVLLNVHRLAHVVIPSDSQKFGQHRRI